VTGAVEALAGWPLAGLLGLAVTAGVVRTWRRRVALNEALHELRRPLQAIALGPAPEESAARPGGETPVGLAAAALERLECEINGGARRRGTGEVRARPLLEAAVGRWVARARLSGGTLELSWRAGEAIVLGDRVELSQAFDNLIVNAIEHGGPTIGVEAARRGEQLAISVVDSGRAARPASRRDNPAEVLGRLVGRRRRGHGLVVVRRVAAAHGGRFALSRSERGSRAVLELPLADGGHSPAA
jgi:signal transduction histidine kinase